MKFIAATQPKDLSAGWLRIRDEEECSVSMSDISLMGWMRALIGYVRSGEPDLTNRQMALFMLVYLSPGPHTVRGLARLLGVSKPVVTRALNSLGALGYLRRERDQDDRRNVFVVRTNDGTRFLEGFKRYLKADDSALRGFIGGGNGQPAVEPVYAAR